MSDAGFFQLDNDSLIGTFSLESVSFYIDSYIPYIQMYFRFSSIVGPSTYYTLYRRLNNGSWVRIMDLGATNQISNTRVANFRINNTDLDFNTIEFAAFPTGDFSANPISYAKFEYSSNTLKTEEIYVGEYDYTQYFEDLVSNSETQNTLITTIKNNVQLITEKAVSNHAMFFVLFLLALTVLVERALKGVIK